MAVGRLLMVAVVLSAAAWAQEDLTRPPEADRDTLCLLHLDRVVAGETQDAAGGPPAVVAGALETLGRFGGALSFAGTPSPVDLQKPTNLPERGGLTVECWAKFRGRAEGDLICRNMEYMMRISGVVQAYLGIDGAWRQVHGATAVPVGRWTHLAMTYDQASKQVRIYLDGRLDVAATPEGITEGRLNSGDATLRLGGNTWATHGVPDGKLDEVRISSVAREYTPAYPLPQQAVPENTNLVPNASFEFGMHGWRANGEANTLLQWRIQEGEAPHGRAFLRSTEERGYSIITYPFTIVPGKAHAVSAMMRADAPCRGRLALRCTGTGRGAARPGGSQSFEVTESWQRVGGKIEVPADWPNDRAFLEVTKPESVTLDLDAVSVVVGEQGEYTQTEAQSVGVRADLPTQSTYLLREEGGLPIQVVNVGERERELSVDCRVTDWQGRPVMQQQLEVGRVPAAGSSPTALRVPTDRVGWYTADFAIREGEETLGETQRMFNVIEPMRGVGEVVESPIGMNTHMEREPTEHLDCNLGMLSQCGAKWIRAWWGWGMAEKQPGQFDWTEYDRQLEAVNRAGMEIMPILLRYYPGYEHDWAGKTDRIQQPPYDMKQWASFVETTVRRYRGRVKAWEVWNEPTFTMEADYYAELLKVTYERIKAADPEALVIGFGGVSTEYIRQVFEAGSAPCMDVIAHHSYGSLSRPWEQMAHLAAQTELLIQEFGATSRVWHSEQGTGADDAGYIALGQSEQECASDLVRGYLSALATGVEKFFWFSAQTSPTYGWAVFYENYVPRPRLVALNGLARLLKGRSVTERMELAEGLVACVLLEGEVGAAAALWSLRDLAAISLPTAQRVTGADMLGNPIEPRTVGGMRSFDLAMRQPIYLLAPELSGAQLARLLRQARVQEQFPVRASARRAEDGSLEVALENAVQHSLDLEVAVQAPELFDRAPEATVLVDLPPGETRRLTLRPDKRPAGPEVTVRVTVRVGEHGIRENSEDLKVRF